MRKEQTSHKNEHNTLMCFPLEPVFTRDKRRLPNFIDEPFVGLDPEAAFHLKNLMKEACQNGSAIFFSTHVLEVAEKICDTVSIIKSGHLIANGTMEEIKGHHSLEDVFMGVVENDEKI